MKALITVYTERLTETHEIILRSKKEEVNYRLIGEEINQTIKRYLRFGRIITKVKTIILEKNRKINEWIYKPTIR